MARKIRPLPGTACRFHIRGRCLYEERLNPGWNRAWRCRVLLRWERAYDTFLDQADNFVMEPATAKGIWENRLQRLMRLGHGCPDFEPGGKDEMTGCRHIHADLCLAALPACPGQCRNFDPGGPGRGTPQRSQGE